jgi:hypothetical protein
MMPAADTGAASHGGPELVDGQAMHSLHERG